jgi:hypothetical protein
MQERLPAVKANPNQPPLASFDGMAGPRADGAAGEI